MRWGERRWKDRERRDRKFWKVVVWLHVHLSVLLSLLTHVIGGAYHLSSQVDTAHHAAYHIMDPLHTTPTALDTLIQHTA